MTPINISSHEKLPSHVGEIERKTTTKRSKQQKAGSQTFLIFHFSLYKLESERKQ
jgi:hypothetical protein